MKANGVPIVSGEFTKVPKKLKYRLNQISQICVSTVALKYLYIAHRYARSCVFDPNDRDDHSNTYDQFKGQLRKLYNKRGKDKEVLLEKMDKVFDYNMQLGYEKLSRIPIVILGDGIGKIESTSHIISERTYEKVNTRIIIVDEQDKEFIQDLIRSINPEIAESIVCLTKQEVSSVQKNYNTQIKKNPNSIFTEAFKDRLPFEISDGFQIVYLEKEILIKEINQDGQPKLSRHKCEVAYNISYDINRLLSKFMYGAQNYK